MSEIRTAAVAAGALVVAEVLRRALARRVDGVPAEVSAKATRLVTTLRVDPCSGARAPASDFTSYYIAQKQALIARFGSTLERVCSVPALQAGGFDLGGLAALSGSCVVNPFKSIPANVPPDCERKVLDEWIRAGEQLLAEAGGWTPTASLRTELVRLVGGLKLFRSLLSNAATVPADVNARIWSLIGRMSVALQGVQVRNGSARTEAVAELAGTLADPAAYLGVVADVGGFLLDSKVGAIALVAGAGFIAWRSL
jgi:hypothetical protein